VILVSHVKKNRGEGSKAHPKTPTINNITQGQVASNGKDKPFCCLSNVPRVLFQAGRETQANL
jgi:hypothetical protein